MQDELCQVEVGPAVSCVQISLCGSVGESGGQSVMNGLVGVIVLEWLSLIVESVVE